MITGFSTSSTTRRGDAFVAYYESNGTQRYFKPFGIPLLSSSATSYYRAIAVDGAGQLVAGGAVNGDLDFGFGPTTNADGRAFFLKQAASGPVRWVQRFGSSDRINVEGVAVSPENHVLVSGTTDENLKLGAVSLTPDSFVLSLTP